MMDKATTLNITVTSDRTAALRGAAATSPVFAGALGQLDPAVRQELAALEPAVLQFLRADPKNVQAFAKDPVGTLRDAVQLSPKAVAAIGAVRAQSAKQFPGVPGAQIDRITLVMANEA
jgi:hypothetical protein